MPQPFHKAAANKTNPPPPRELIQPGPLRWEMPGGHLGTHTDTREAPPDQPALPWRQRRDPHPCDVLDSEETGHDVLIRRSGNVLHLHRAVLLEPWFGPVLQTGLWREEEQLAVTGDVHWDMGLGHHASEATASGMEWLALDIERGGWHRGWPPEGTPGPRHIAGGRIPQLVEGSKLKGQVHTPAPMLPSPCHRNATADAAGDGLCGCRRIQDGPCLSPGRILRNHGAAPSLLSNPTGFKSCSATSTTSDVG